MEKMSEFRRYKRNYRSFVRINEAFGLNSLPAKVERLRIGARRILETLQSELKSECDEDEIEFALEDEAEWTPEVVDLVFNFDRLVQVIGEMIEKVRDAATESLDEDLGGEAEIAGRREAHMAAGNISLEPVEDRYHAMVNGLSPMDPGDDEPSFEEMEDESSDIHNVTQRIAGPVDRFNRSNGSAFEEGPSTSLVGLDVFEGDDEEEEGVELRVIESDDWED